jgi:hypothetical protein
MQRRGRPRDDANVKAKDEIIARTADTLIWWGLSRRNIANEKSSKVYEAVGKQAKEVLGRTDSNGNALGQDRIEQIHEQWAITKGRGRYTKRSLKERVPNKIATIEEFASFLLRNKGEWPDPTPIIDPATGEIRCLIDPSTGETEPCIQLDPLTKEKAPCIGGDGEIMPCPATYLPGDFELTPKANDEYERLRLKMPYLKKQGN